jgi:hypothetical protein
MLRTLAHRHDQRLYRLLVIARTPDELLFRTELHHLPTQLDLIIVELLRQPPPGWTGATGDITPTLLTTLLTTTPPTRPTRLLPLWATYPHHQRRGCPQPAENFSHTNPHRAFQLHLPTPSRYTKNSAVRHSTEIPYRANLNRWCSDAGPS